MKKQRLCILLAVVFLTALSGCVSGEPLPADTAPPAESPAASSPQPSDSAAPSASGAESPEPSVKVPRGGDDAGLFTPMGSADGYGMILFDSSSLPITEGGNDGTLELFVRAEQEGGKIAWNDGQSWYLIVRDGKNVFKLLDEVYVQNGQVEVWSYWSYDKKAPCVLAMIRQGAGITEYLFTYDSASDVFIRTKVFAAEGNISLLHGGVQN